MGKALCFFFLFNEWALSSNAPSHTSRIMEGERFHHKLGGTGYVQQSKKQQDTIESKRKNEDIIICHLAGCDLWEQSGPEAERLPTMHL